MFSTFFIIWDHNLYLCRFLRSRGDILFTFAGLPRDLDLTSPPFSFPAFSSPVSRAWRNLFSFTCFFNKDVKYSWLFSSLTSVCSFSFRLMSMYLFLNIFILSLQKRFSKTDAYFSRFLFTWILVMSNILDRILTSL